MQRQVKTDAGFKQVLYFLIGFGAAEGGIQVGKYDLGHFETQGPRNFAADQFGYQCLYALPRSAEFEHIQKSVIRFGNSRQRAALAQGRYITGYIYGA